MKHKIIIVIIAAVFILGVIGSVLVLTSAPKNTVNIIRDGKVLYTVDLSTAENKMINIPCGDHFNNVEIRDGKIRVESADCPDQTCVNMGWLSSSAMPIVCLPHHLVIEFTDSDGGVDAVTR